MNDKWKLQKCKIFYPSMFYYYFIKLQIYYGTWLAVNEYSINLNILITGEIKDKIKL